MSNKTVSCPICKNEITTNAPGRLTRDIEAALNEYARVHSPTGPTERHKFLRYPLGQFSKSQNDIGKCWHVVNMLFCGLPAEAQIHQFADAPTGKVSEGDEALIDRIVNVECGRDDNGFATCSPSALHSSIATALATVRKDAREAAFKEALAALKVHQQAVRDRHYGVLTLAIESVEAAANGEAKGGDDG